MTRDDQDEAKKELAGVNPSDASGLTARQIEAAAEALRAGDPVGTAENLRTALHVMPAELSSSGARVTVPLCSALAKDAADLRSDEVVELAVEIVCRGAASIGTDARYVLLFLGARLALCGYLQFAIRVNEIWVRIEDEHGDGSPYASGAHFSLAYLLAEGNRFPEANRELTLGVEIATRDNQNCDDARALLDHGGFSVGVSLDTPG